MSLRFAYNTNGTANHRIEDAIRLIKDAGYDGVALTLDIHHLDPFAENWVIEADRIASLLNRLELGSVIETGARFLLDPTAKHEPTLVTADASGRARRVGFLKRAIEIGKILNSEAVSFWAGVPKPGVDHGEARGWLIEGLREVADFAAEKGVVAALEPEPGMLIETLDDFAAIDLPGLSLALDTGHCLVTGERDPAAAVHEFAPRLGTVAIEDMKRGEHIHLPFGEGDMDVPAVLDALDAIGFSKLVCVELSRESHRADVMVVQSLDYLRTCRRPGPGLPMPDTTPREAAMPGLPTS
ncbi:UNVERIFIED_ORG: D-psicose/D-tagatose/L-ribulose 3-epimerase [Methylobacterium sp. SuP10 SLI 274]|uniref:sugar phosphate isomerase/epimerase family protein n=1 Tax=Methylorubrum extorquens TaxID=408 RepID=UPI00209F4BF4|nr:sugar phosphate isomerase/epimerase family protein [Methylorubrum extorquens]MDF9865095.1 D-psicose/D-tagatose/L-ribulose 3-epimerase [Methylorubrum pseudosasae]MDH6638664.1 D-psicose/D-tagatose/L-ribulose 3-epimerase [Methylobacterium sp. SuP10 SLI 274]MDH6667851.1 D-psicose/D-tagatose/L-ribulose 3-epimerase [Methylorubrum zatmanii]MCP1559745.1 sugar phosphate isomerase/epimerase [Methylorubrum extorquens]MDF9793389.1 D-psicose/D-tagatose/L-ribulose 3-epimerase [Methylorubrum extorquens]